MVKVFGVIEKGITVVENVGEKLADAVGGAENLFRLVALAVAAIFTAWKLLPKSCWSMELSGSRRANTRSI